ncbi:MAG TPA: hypothetical protein VIM79_23665 [Niastella sp.]
MKQLSTLLFLIVLISCKQENALLQYKQHFDQELKPWTNSFYHFNLDNFKKGKTLPFEKGNPQDLTSYKEFIATYRPVLTFSPDGSKFIDLYAGQLHLVKTGDIYEGSADDGGPVLLCDPATKYWDRICYNSPGEWIEEVTWISKTKFILAGITKPSSNSIAPYILIGDTEKKTLDQYLNTNPKCLQHDPWYTSPKMKKIRLGEI